MQFVKGNLLDAETQALVNTVNTVGVMGKGIALQFKEEFPNNFKIYLDACKRKELQPGKMLVVKEPTKKGARIIINFPTKTFWYQKSRYEYIEEGLKALVETISENEIRSIAIPPLGCGNGGLLWGKVKHMMEQYLGALQNVDIIIYEPNEAVKALLKAQETDKKVKLTPAKATLLYAMFYYEASGEPVSLFVANKLAYFLQRIGDKAFNRLKFSASHYGPYSTGVEHMLQAMNGKYLKGLEQMSAKTFEPLELQYNTAKEVSEYIKKELSPDTAQRLKSLTALIDGFQSALSLEILATVDFLLQSNPSATEDEIIIRIKDWSARKKNLFQERYIRIAYNHLGEYQQALLFG